MSLPSVTAILRRFGLTVDYERVVPADKLTLLRQRGTALHKAIELYDAGTLDLESVHPAIRPGLDAYAAWVQDVRHEAWQSEPELVSDTWGFLGHPDRIGTVHGEPCVVDWKFTDSPDLRGGRYQLAGYKLLWNGQARTPIAETFLVALSPTGKGYKLHRLTDPAADQVFQAAVILYRALEPLSPTGGTAP